MLKAYVYSQYTAIKRSSSTPTPTCSRRCASFEDSYPSSNTCWTCTFSIYKTARAIPTTASSKIATKFPIEPKATAGIQMNTWRRNFLQIKSCKNQHIKIILQISVSETAFKQNLTHL